MNPVEDAAELPRAAGRLSLREWRPGKYRLSYEASENVRELVSPLALKVFLRLRENIFGLTAHTVPGGFTVSVYHSLPAELSLAEARAIIDTTD